MRRHAGTSLELNLKLLKALKRKDAPPRARRWAMFLKFAEKKVYEAIRSGNSTGIRFILILSFFQEASDLTAADVFNEGKCYGTRALCKDIRVRTSKYQNILVTCQYRRFQLI